MTYEAAQLVAHELKQAGFEAVTNLNSVKVFLSNRQPSTMEVEMALMDIFGEVEFKLHKTNTGVLVG